MCAHSIQALLRKTKFMMETALKCSDCFLAKNKINSRTNKLGDMKRKSEEMQSTLHTPCIRFGKDPLRIQTPRNPSGQEPQQGRPRRSLLHLLCSLRYPGPMAHLAVYNSSLRKQSLSSLDRARDSRPYQVPPFPASPDTSDNSVRQNNSQPKRLE